MYIPLTRPSQLATSSKHKPSTLRPIDFESNIRAPQDTRVRGGTRGRRGVQGTQKDVGVVKGLVERVEESAKWMEDKRNGVSFGPGRLADVEMWEANLGIEDSPLGRYVKVQRKARMKRKDVVDKVRAVVGLGCKR